MNLDTYGMFNWTHDLPKNNDELVKFLEILQLLPKDKPIKILEIGTFVGISIIKMLELLPNATAVVIDNWNLSKKELEECEKISGKKLQNPYQVFTENIKKAGMENRIQILIGDSYTCLNYLIKKNEQLFDFIYVDGSHTCLDTHSDLILSFQLLKNNGIMGVDDFTFDFKELETNPLNIPYKAITHFIEKNSTSLKILSSSYRIFFRKVEL